MNDFFMLGDMGPEIELIQSTLKKLQYYTGEIDGKFGPKTKEAVITFQKNFGIRQDGIVGKETLDKLFPYINGYTYYRIMAGDTLYKISNYFNTNINYILFANPNLNPYNLRINEVIIVPFGEVVNTDISYTYTIMEADLLALRIIYPFLEFGSIGNSVLNKQIPYVKIGNGKKQVLYNASIHANEWITSVLLMKFIERFSSAYVLDDYIFGYRARELFEECSLYIIPMMNPDGVELVTGYIKPQNEIYDEAKKIANNYPEIPFPSGWKANIKGVNLKKYQPIHIFDIFHFDK